MPDAENGLGNGLQNMKNRISEIGGTLEFHSRKEEGTSIIFYI
jgi:signal transduction histidine kinase